MVKKVLLVDVLCGLVVCGFVQPQAIYSKTFQTIERITSDGYPGETHRVTTSDGYILEMHRIPDGRTSKTTEDKKPVVFLMHGLMGASNNYIFLGANYSIAYNLADEGFDVWMGNARGNYHSRAHVTLDPDDSVQKFQFFNFTFEEIGLYDLPAMIDYALEHTGNKQLQYIGHSQGGTAFLVLTSSNIEYNKKIAAAHLLAGVGYQGHFPDEYLKQEAASVDFIYALALMMGIVELEPDLIDLPTNATKAYKIPDFCSGNIGKKLTCELFGTRHLMRSDSTDNALQPGGGSLKQAAHYGQNIRDKIFRRYHYREENKLVYGSELPPVYDLSLISCNVTMHYSMSDNLLDERDVLDMVEDMPNARARRVRRESFEHSDYIASPDSKELVTDYIIVALKETAGGSDRTALQNVYLAAFSLVSIFVSSRNF